MEDNNDDRDKDGDPSSPEFSRPRKQSYHRQNQACHSTNQSTAALLFCLPFSALHTPLYKPCNTQVRPNGRRESCHQQPHQQQVPFISDLRSSSTPRIDNTLNLTHYSMMTNKSRNNS